MIAFSEDTCGSQNTIFFRSAILASPKLARSGVLTLDHLFEKINRLDKPLPRTPLEIESTWEVTLRVH